jgi:DNA-binding NtrC family response regulator
MSKQNILVVDDEKNMLRSLQNVLAAEGWGILTAESGTKALKVLQETPVSLIISDARMPEMDGFGLLDAVKKKFPALPFIMMTAYATPQLAVRAIKAGAHHYLQKPFDPEELIHAVEAAMQRERLLEENRQLKAEKAYVNKVDDIIGASPKMQQVRELIATVAPTNSTVLIVGESGTGKELVAGALHSHSARSDKPFVRVNCAAIPENLLESEFFGHEKGAFTGADRQRRGRFEDADGGTILLDEIGDMSRQLQSKMLRVLEDGTFTRVGGNDQIKVNVRVLAATNRDIQQAIRDKEFREDLYHRLNVIQIALPPLRERRDDITELAGYFLQNANISLNKKVLSFSDDAMQLMRSYSWPGNVRELKNAVERAVIVEKGNQIQPQSLPPFAPPSPGEKPSVALDASLEETINQIERQLIEQALLENRGSMNKTAARLKISRHALRYRMQKLGMSVDEVFENE